MGAQHGALTRELGGFEEVLAYYPKMPRILLGGAGRLLSPALELALRGLERRRPAAYRERARAFFRGLGLSPHMSRNVFVMDLLQNTVGLVGRFGIGPVMRTAPPGCSTLVVWDAASADGGLRHARNFDFPGSGLWERWPAVVFCEPDEGLRYGFVTTRGADVPVTSFNEAGLTLSVHTCFHCDVRFDGVGVVDLCHEIIRTARTLEQAVAVARRRPVASSWNLCVSSASERRAVTIEVSGEHLRVIEPNPGEPFHATTNHYRTDLARREVLPSPALGAHSRERLAVLRRHATGGAAEGGLDADALAALLGSHEDAHDPARERACGGVLAQGISVKSVVCEPERGRILVSVGECPTGKGPYVEVPFAWGDGVGYEVWEPGSRPTLMPQGDSRFDAGGALEGHRASVRASALSGQGAPDEEIAAELERAVTFDPEEASYRLPAAGFRLAVGALDRARDHLDQGLAAEWAPFRRGQLLLWAARTADAAGHRGDARRFRSELAGLPADLVEPLTRDAARTFTKRRLRRVHVNVDFPDLLVQ
jgi:hypothetical protein